MSEKNNNLTTKNLSIFEKDSKPIQSLLSRAGSEAAAEVIKIADNLSDMTIFHKRVRKNGTAMMQPWGDD
ncbi:MAG: hypothetical protein IJI14_01530 [Anaerolineaceae bacterium]|nr:hypothetical protein [Anaerolineaceae bacterium]